MLFHNVWLYRWALVMLQHYETYGVDLTQNRFGLFEMYYAGNFWWAKARYLRSLNREFVSRKSFLNARAVSESWLGTGLLPNDSTLSPTTTTAPLERRMLCFVESVLLRAEHGELGVERYTKWDTYLGWSKVVHRLRSPDADPTPVLPCLTCCHVCISYSGLSVYFSCQETPETITTAKKVALRKKVGKRKVRM